MSIKGAIQSGHAPRNKYRLIMVGLPPLTPTRVSGLESDTEAVELPDRTTASGGNEGIITFVLSPRKKKSSFARVTGLESNRFFIFQKTAYFIFLRR